MNAHSIKEQLVTLFRKSKKDRHRFLANHLSANIAAQIFSLRTSLERQWTQAELAKKAGIRQPRIPVYESPDYGAFSLATLKKLAHAFDVALLIKFVSFDELAEEISNQSPENIAVSTFENPLAPQQFCATTQSMKFAGQDFIIHTEDGQLICGQYKLQERPYAQLTVPHHGSEGIYSVAMPNKQTAVVSPAIKINKEKLLVNT